MISLAPFLKSARNDKVETTTALSVAVHTALLTSPSFQVPTELLWITTNSIYILRNESQHIFPLLD